MAAFKVHNTSADGYSRICKRCSRRGAKTRSQRAARPAPEGVTSKHCAACGATKPFADFAQAKGGKYGLYSKCKACVRAGHHADRDARLAARNVARLEDDWFRRYAQEYAVTHRHIWRDYGERSRAGGFDWKRKYPERARESNKLRARAWRLRNPEKHKLRTAAASLRRRAESEVHTADLRVVWDAQSGVCRWCKTPLIFGEGAHLDHIIPLSKGGDNRLSNLCWSCKCCNLNKSDKMPHEFAGVLF